MSEEDFALAWRLRPESWVRGWAIGIGWKPIVLDTGSRMEKARRILVSGEPVTKVGCEADKYLLSKTGLTEICQQTWAQIFGGTL